MTTDGPQSGELVWPSEVAAPSLNYDECCRAALAESPAAYRSRRAVRQTVSRHDRRTCYDRMIRTAPRDRSTNITAYRRFRACYFGHATISIVNLSRVLSRCPLVYIERPIHQFRSPRRRSCCAQCLQTTVLLRRLTCTPHANRLHEVQNHVIPALQTRSTFVG
jgi:hypothetical protein